MQNLMQRGLSSFLGSGGSDQNSMKTALTQLQNQVSNDPNHPLIQQVRSDAGLQDNNQAKQYTQQALNTLNDHTENNPQELHSVFGNIASSKGFDIGSLLRGGSSGGIGGLLGGAEGNTSSNTSSQEQQQKKQQQQQQKGGGIGGLLGEL